MAGTLTISTLSDGTNSTSATNCIQGSAKAWVNFNGVTTATIRASYNISSVTRIETGSYQVNFTNAMVDANYSVVGIGRHEKNTAQAGVLINVDTNGTSNITTTSVRIQTMEYNTSRADSPYCSIAIFR